MKMKNKTSNQITAVLFCIAGLIYCIGGFINDTLTTSIPAGMIQVAVGMMFLAASQSKAKRTKKAKLDI
jgi:hypothetical protein